MFGRAVSSGAAETLFRAKIGASTNQQAKINMVVLMVFSEATSGRKLSLPLS